MTRLKTLLSLMCAAAMLSSGAHDAEADDHVWSHPIGGPDADYPWDIAANAAGSTAVTGYFFGSMVVGNDTLSSSGSTDIFIVNFNTAGTVVWSRALGSTGYDAGLGVCVDANGAVIVTGYFEGTVDFGGGPLTSAGETDIFIVKYGALGDHVWSKRFGDITGDAGADICVNASGAFAVTGISIGTVDFGGGALSSLGGGDSFVAVFDAGGNHVWSDMYGGTDPDAGWKIAMDGLGVTTVAGYFQGSADFGGGSMMSAGDKDIYLARYDAGGGHMWSNRYGAAGEDMPEGLALDSSGQPAFTATFRDTVDFGGGDLISANGADIALAQYDANGNHLWSRRFGGIGFDKVYGLDIDGLDRAVIVGGFPTTIDFGGGPMVSLGYDDVFIAKFDNTGAWVSSVQFGTAGDDKAHSVAIDGYEGIAIAGTFETGIDLGGGLLVNPRVFDLDGFVARFRPSAATGVARNVPTSLILDQNYPNPFNPTTRISFSVPDSRHILLRVYDVRGSLVRTLLDRTMAGPNAVEWDGRDDAGKAVSSGIYFYRLDAGTQSLARKMVLLK